MTTDKTTDDDLIRVKQETIAREFARMDAEAAKMRQVGGDHYKDLTPSPATTIED
jgi:hypothetical protein